MNEREERRIFGRWGEVDDLIGLCIFLASDASEYITGQDIFIDGGWLYKGLQVIAIYYEKIIAQLFDSNPDMYKINWFHNNDYKIKQELN